MALRYFELQLLDLTGYRPRLFDCARCGSVLKPETNYYSSEAGGALCPRCAEGEPGALLMTLGTFKVLRYMQTRPYGQCAALRVTARTRLDLERLMQDNMAYILERRLKSVEFLHLLYGTGAQGSTHRGRPSTA
jgi:DNA repair protein RecO (recombination protein O)